jgi:hypothetical protein
MIVPPDIFVCGASTAPRLSSVEAVKPHRAPGDHGPAKSRRTFPPLGRPRPLISGGRARVDGGEWSIGRPRGR